MIRQIIKIDAEKCNGCGLCANACHEDAIEIHNGKAELIRDDYCDGLGNCLPVCPVNAISFEQREAAEFDEEAVKMHKSAEEKPVLACGCPGTHSRMIKHEENVHSCCSDSVRQSSQLSQWSVQIKLVPVNAPYFNDCDLLVAADCTAYAYGSFHNDFIKNRITVVGCPKLDDVDYTEKLAEIFRHNNVKSVYVARMEVPCCYGIEKAVKNAIELSGKSIKCEVKVISTDGRIL